MKVRLTDAHGDSLEGDAMFPPREGQPFQMDVMQPSDDFDGFILTTEPVTAVLGEGVFLTEGDHSFIVQIVDMEFVRRMAHA